MSDDSTVPRGLGLPAGPLARSCGHFGRPNSEALWEFFRWEAPLLCANARSPLFTPANDVLPTLHKEALWAVTRVFCFFFPLPCASHCVPLPATRWVQAVQRGLRFHSSGPGNGLLPLPTPLHRRRRLTPTPSRPDRKSTAYLKLFAGAHSNKHYRSLCVVAGHLWIFDSSES